MNRFARYCLVIAITCVFGQPIQAAPQEFGAGGQSVPGNEIANFKGKLKTMRGNVVFVEKDDGTDAMVMVPDSIASFQFIAKAVPAFLRPGMMVRFNGNFGPGGVPTSPITKVTVFHPVNTKTIQGRAKLQFTPGVHSDKPAGRNQPLTGPLTVVGSLIGISGNGVMAVRAGKFPVQVPVNQETALEIRYNSLSLAKPGDPVSVAGFFQAGNEKQIKADRITVTTDRVYGVAPEKEDRRSKRKENGDEDGDAAKPDGEGDKPAEGDAKADGGEKDDAEQAEEGAAEDS